MSQINIYRIPSHVWNRKLNNYFDQELSYDK